MEKKNSIIERYFIIGLTLLIIFIISINIIASIR